LFIASELVPVEPLAVVQGWPLAPMRPVVARLPLHHVPGVPVVGFVGEVGVVPMLSLVAPTRCCCR
jgi:hypothetical protein